MTKKAANEETLGTLHAKVAEVMLNALNSTDMLNEQIAADNEKARQADQLDAIRDLIEPSPALLGAITKFLKDNEITCNTEDSVGLTALQQQLANKSRLPARPKNEGQKVVQLRELPVTEDEDALRKLGLA